MASIEYKTCPVCDTPKALVIYKILGKKKCNRCGWPDYNKAYNTAFMRVLGSAKRPLGTSRVRFAKNRARLRVKMRNSKRSNYKIKPIEFKTLGFGRANSNSKRRFDLPIIEKELLITNLSQSNLNSNAESTGQI